MKNLMRLSQRVVNYLRPKPRFIPLTVEQVLSNSLSLDIVNQFNDIYYSGGHAGDLNWRGTPMIKNPCDIWMIIELFQNLRPSVVIETGTHKGGSASFYADMLKILEINADVITIDINPKWNFEPLTKNIHSIVGYSTDADSVSAVDRIVRGVLGRRPGHVLVMLDSEHSEANVFAELNIYSKFVTLGSYLIVEDTNVNGHPSLPSHGAGPWEAAEKFLEQNAEFQRDPECQRFLLTYNPGGWLKRVR